MNKFFLPINHIFLILIKFLFNLVAIKLTVFFIVVMQQNNKSLKIRNKLIILPVCRYIHSCPGVKIRNVIIPKIIIYCFYVFILINITTLILIIINKKLLIFNFNLIATFIGIISIIRSLNLYRTVFITVCNII